MYIWGLQLHKNTDYISKIQFFYKFQNDEPRQLLFNKVYQPFPFNEKYALKPVICEGRHFSGICHVEVFLDAFPN